VYKRQLAIVEPELAFAVRLIRAVATQAMLGEQGGDLPVIIHGGAEPRG
jgi:hypothetical protein